MLMIVFILEDGCQLCYDAGDCYHAWGWLSVTMLMIVIMLGDSYQLPCWWLLSCLGMVISYRADDCYHAWDGCQLCYDAGDSYHAWGWLSVMLWCWWLLLCLGMVISCHADDCYHAWGWLSVIMLMIVIMRGDGYQLSCIGMVKFVIMLVIVIILEDGFHYQLPVSC